MTLYTEAAPAVKFEFKAIGALKAAKGPDGKMRLHGIASSTTRDLHGDVMTETALQDMENSANKNLTIFLNHSYSVPEDVGGSVEQAIRKTRDVDHSGNPNVDLELDIVIDDTNPRAVQTWNSIQSGTRLGLSIGANLPEGGYKRNKDGSYVIEHCELLETSIVGVPANPRSWVEYAVKALNDAHADTQRTVAFEKGEAILVGAICPECGGTKSAPLDDCKSGYHAAAEPTVVAEVEPVIPEVADATVHIDIDTDNSDGSGVGAPPSQEAQASAPGAEAVVEETADGEDAALGDTVTAGATPDIAAGHFAVPTQQMTDLVNSYAQTVQELMALRLTNVGLQTAKSEAERDRDQAIADRDRVLAETTALLTRLADVPLVRRTAVTAAYGEFRQKFGGVYDDGFLKMLENKADD